jgi:Cu-processing system ATP-binding protein
VLEDICLDLEKGMVVGIIGPNGSGKTTLIKCLLGLTTPDNGEILYNQLPAKKHSDYRKVLGYMPQIGRYPENMTIEQLFNMLRDIREKVTTELDESLIESFKLKEMMHKTLGSLSGGTIQKVSAAIAYLFTPEVLILDEPTAGLDPLASEILKDKIRQNENEKLTLITSHILNDLDELATHILFLNECKITFFSEVETLRKEYGDLRLGKIIAGIMNRVQKGEHTYV